MIFAKSWLYVIAGCSNLRFDWHAVKRTLNADMYGLLKVIYVPPFPLISINTLDSEMY